MQQQLTIADIFREYGDSYISRNNIRGQQKGLIHLLSYCHTSVMGSHYEMCDHCRYIAKAYNSCRNRHCPTCQQKDKLLWMDKRMKELLPVGYYHLVFTIPHELNPLCLKNKKVMYDILFTAASQTLLELSRDTNHLGADIGLIAVLHTWGQNMMEHPHLHCIMPSGGMSFDKEHWVHIRMKNGFFVHYKVLSQKFRGKFLALVKEAWLQQKLELRGSLSLLASKANFSRFLDKLYLKPWVVNIQKPLGNPEKILEYLSRYVFRVAITDRRIIEVKDGKVPFSWKDYRSGLFRKMWLDIDEFIRRFLLHTLPKGFFKVRYYGLFASRVRRQNIDLAKSILQQEVLERNQESLEDGCCVRGKQDAVWNEILQMILNYRKPNCPLCHKGRLHFAGIVPRNHGAPG
jgi:hypothetical protein